ncbi:MAG: TetR/AcrR family transcriptional regulator, partial [Clostridia bacterium]|nr:TetR/AcrR family transcriptional regulator [Clostridia bacterium]
MKKGEIKRQALLASAEKLFFTKGYGATSINDILETLHCSKGSFYHHFTSKLEVLTALCRQHAEDAFARYRNDSRDESDALKRLDLLLYHSLPTVPEETELAALLMQLISFPEGEQVLDALIAAQEKTFFGELRFLLRSLEEERRAFLPIPGLVRLIWDTHTALYRRLLLI